MTAQKMSAQEIIAFIGNAEKKTNVKVTFEGELATAVQVGHKRKYCTL